MWYFLTDTVVLLSRVWFMACTYKSILTEPVILVIKSFVKSEQYNVLSYLVFHTLSDVSTMIGKHNSCYLLAIQPPWCV